jgi:hypothetical protein
MVRTIRGFPKIKSIRQPNNWRMSILGWAVYSKQKLMLPCIPMAFSI